MGSKDKNRATPAESPFTSWLGSLFTPASQSPAADEGPSPIDWGAGALAAAAGMSAYYLSKRHEEEEAQRRAVQEQVAAKNEALRAQEAQQREQAKIENYQQGKAMLNEALANSGLSQAEQDAIRAQAQTNGMTAGLNLTAAAVTAQQARYEGDNAWLAQADKSESERLEDIQKSPEYQAREIERLAILNWIKTGENPPPSMMDKTEDERLEMYKDTHAYQSQQASLAAWQAEQEKKKQVEDANRVYADLRAKANSPFVAGSGDGHVVHPNDISQNLLPNCFFLSSLAAVAHQNPDFVYNNIKPNLDGSYSVTLYGAKNPDNPDNSFTYLVTPDKFHSDDSKMARLGDANRFLQENWVRIYESAYLNSKGGYWVTTLPVSLGVGNIFYPSDALQTITGNPAIVLSPKDTKIDELAKKFDEGYAVVASTPFKVDPGNPLFDSTKPEFLYASHEYFITAVDTTNNTVDVRNPHEWRNTPGNQYYLQMDYADFQDGFQTITMASTAQP